MPTLIKVNVNQRTQSPSYKYNAETKQYTPDFFDGIKMSVVCNTSEEDKKFFDSTPSGTIEFSTINHEAAQAFSLGSQMYVTFETPEEYAIRTGK